MKDYAYPFLGGIVGMAMILLVIVIPSPEAKRRDEMNAQLTRIADALELIASAVKTQ